MPDMLNTAVSGLLSFQRALGTVSHNIANVNTDGYSRQRVSITTQPPSIIGGLNYGNGARVESVDRLYNQFLTNEMRNTTSSFSKLDFLAELEGHVDDVLADPQGGISPVLHEFFSSVQDVADDPSSSTARYNMINTANTLASRFQNINTRFQQLEENTAKDIRSVVTEINDLVESIRKVNLDLDKISPSGINSQQSSDLLDTRDKLLLQLSEKIDITVINESDSNNITILIGNGQTVLNGVKSFTLGAIPNAGDPSKDVIVYNGFSQVLDLSDSLRGGGELGALLEFRDTVMSETRNDLGRVAVAIANTFNEQQRAGMDLNNDLGQDFFTVADPQVLVFNGNSGTTNILGSAITDVTQLTRFDYTLEFDGANWTMTSDSGTTLSPPVAHNPAGTTIEFEGFSVTVDGNPNAGDRFRVKPTYGGAGSFDVVTTDPLLIAAASPIRTEASLDNLGTTRITRGAITDAANPNLLDNVTLTFSSATSFTSTSDVTVNGSLITAGNPIAFSNDMVIESNGWSSKLSGIPAAGDVLTVTPNNDARGDNSNALELANLQVDRILDGGSSNYQEAYSTMVGRVGSQTASTLLQRDSAQSVLIQARDRLSSKTGVNLDEEAADLVRFQQAYEAASRIISTTQTLFESLLAAVR